MKQKKGIKKSSKTIQNRSFNYISFEHTSILQICLLKSARFILHTKTFLKDLPRQRKNKKNRESMTLVNEIRNHGYFT